MSKTIIRVLAVDDETLNTELIKRTFRNHDNVQLHTATSGAQALTLLEQEQAFDVMLVDQSMPGMSGVEFLEKASEAFPGSVNIMVTGFPELSDVLNAQEVGLVRHIIPKPWRSEDLLQAVERAVNFAEMSEAVSNLKDKKLLK